MSLTMPALEDLLEEARVAHGHLCAGQVLGVRLAMLGCNRLGIEQPRGRDRKRLVTFVEIARCATDAIGVVPGGWCGMGRHSASPVPRRRSATTNRSHQGMTALKRMIEVETFLRSAEALLPPL